MKTNGVLMAGGAPVHRVTKSNVSEEEQRPRPDEVPIIERYSDVAKALHRTVIAPRKDRFIIGCSCGWYALSGIGSYAKAQNDAMGHVIKEAEAIFFALEGHEVGKEPG
jgi:hypothetical protein